MYFCKTFRSGKTIKQSNKSRRQHKDPQKNTNQTYHTMKESEKEVFEPMPEESAEAHTQSPEVSESEARRDMLYGLLWCLGGLAFSFISYYLTEAGGRFVVATGAIVWGAVQAFKGLIVYLRVKRSLGDNDACKRAIALAVGATVAIAGLSYASWRMVHADEVCIVEEEQNYDCPELGLRMTIPAGFSELEATAEEETETTYASYRTFVSNATLAISVEGVAGNMSEEVATAEDIDVYLAEEAEKYFDGGIIERGFVTINGVRMMKHVGTRTQNPEWMSAMYDAVHKGSLITICYHSNGGAPSQEADAFVSERVVFY